MPKCLFKEGTETQVEKVNNTCRTSILEEVEKYVEAEYKEVLADPLFAQVMAIYEHKLQYSGRLIHTFACKQLLTAKRHELWFHYARRPLRFAMQEFHAVPLCSEASYRNTCNSIQSLLCFSLCDFSPSFAFLYVTTFVFVSGRKNLRIIYLNGLMKLCLTRYEN